MNITNHTKNHKINRKFSKKLFLDYQKTCLIYMLVIYNFNVILVNWFKLVSMFPLRIEKIIYVKKDYKKKYKSFKIFYHNSMRGNKIVSLTTYENAKYFNNSLTKKRVTKPLQLSVGTVL